MYEQFKNIDEIDISKEKMEVAPTAHYSMGGVVVDIKCRTKIRGLFAVGEVISQIHGANRLGGNRLTGYNSFWKNIWWRSSEISKGIRRKRKTRTITARGER